MVQIALKSRSWRRCHLAPIEDCYAGLVRMYDSVEELAVDPRRIMVDARQEGATAVCAAAWYTSA